MLAILGMLLIVAWVIAMALKVTAGAIHIAIVLGLVLLFAHFLTKRQAPV